MPGPRVTLVLALLGLGAGLAVTTHSQFIEASGFAEDLSFGEPARVERTFRPHWPRVHFVSLLVAPHPDPGSSDCVDSNGFPRENLGLRWSIRDGDGIVAEGAPPHGRFLLGRAKERVMILGAFRATPFQRYTLELEVEPGCVELDALAPRLEVGLRPGQPFLAYTMAGLAFLTFGVGCLLRFAMREDKSWPYIHLLAWSLRRRSPAPRRPVEGRFDPPR